MAKISNQDLFENYPVRKALITMAWPAIMGQLISLIYNMADTFFIGRLNNPFMVAGISISGPLFMMTAPLAIVGGQGGGSLTSRLLGKHNPDEAKKVAAFSVYLSAALGVLFSLILILFKTEILLALGASENNIGYAKAYITYILCIGAVPTILCVCLSGLLRAVGHSKQAGFGMTMGGVLNIILDPLFMFVLLPSEKAVEGAAIATLISNVASCIYYIIVINRLDESVPLGFSLKEGLPSRESIKELFTVGLPSATTTIMFDLNNIVLNRLMAAYGDYAVAACGIVIKIERFSINTCIGLCMGMAPIVAYNFAAKKYDRMSSVIKETRKLGIIVSAVSFVIYELFPKEILNAFINDPTTVLYGSEFLKRRAFAAMLMFLCFYVIHIFTGVGSGKHTFWLAFIRYGLINIPMLFLLNRLMGMYGLVWGQAVSDLITAIISAIVLKRFMKKLY